MYAFIQGAVSEIAFDRAIVESSGVGFELFCSSLTLRRLVVGEIAKLYTHLHLAEGIMALYGFYEIDEKEMFRRLLSVTRIGPKLALSVLSVLTPADVAAAILTDNAAAFDRVIGMGKKTAQRVLLELKEHVNAEQVYGSGEDGIQKDMRAEAVAALVSLGYDGLSASRAVTAIQECDSVESLITAALKTLAR